ncbi:MAG TPA: hypothetical protein VGF86_04005 [Candidatus Tumulicola sp.]
MTPSRIAAHVAGLCLAVAALAACNGASQPRAGAATAVPPLARAIARQSDRAHSWIEAAAKRSDLLYVSDTVTGDAYVFSYPQGKAEGAITGLEDPAGECVDGQGNVFVTNTGASNVLEYAHGGTSPIATLKDDGYFPVGCSVDPQTGNLAVTNFATYSSQPGNVVIYKHAKGRPTGNYTDPSTSQYLLCGYDDKGNLFADGLTGASAFSLVELRRGATALTPVDLNQPIGSGGGVQWDGTNLAIGDQSTNTIYRFAMTAKKGKLAGATSLGGASAVFQFWIQGGKVLGADSGAADVGVWKYPAGGSAVKTITGAYVPLGVTVSKAR